MKPLVSAHHALFSFFVVLVLFLGAAAAASEAPRSWPPDQFLPLTSERIAQLPAADQFAWKTYFEASQALRQKIPKPIKADFSPNKPLTASIGGGKHAKGLDLHARPAWYSAQEAMAIADHIVEWQTTAGGWQKGNDYSKPREGNTEETDLWSNGTLDNDATTTEIRFLARVNVATNGKAPHAASWQECILRGLHYLFEAQYPNGGYPQVYPLVGGYHDAITFNDDAMTQALEVLRDVVARKPEFAFVPSAVSQEAEERFTRGLRCLLACQIRDEHGNRTVWAQQNDALTLAPCAARNFEPIAATSAESAAIVEFLMSLPRPSSEIVGAVESAVAWFRRTALGGMTWQREGDDRVVKAKSGAPLLWSRLYELNTDKPIFGDRDRTIHYVVAEISNERRRGYAWYGTKPSEVLNAYSNWHDAHVEKKTAGKLKSTRLSKMSPPPPAPRSANLEP